MKINYQWVPNDRIGPFAFGTLANQYIEHYGLIPVPEEYNQKVDWIVYKTNTDDRIYVEDKKIVSVSCSSTCIYKENELIGQPVDKILEYLNCEPDSIESAELSEGFQEIYEFDQLGLQLWVKDGIVITAIVNDSGAD